MGIGQQRYEPDYGAVEPVEESDITSWEKPDETLRAKEETSLHGLPSPADPRTVVTKPTPIEHFNPTREELDLMQQRADVTQIAHGSYIAQAAHGGVATVVNNMIDAIAQEDIEKVGNLSRQLDEFRQERLQGKMSQRISETDITRLESSFKKQLKTVETEISKLQIDRKTHQDALEQLAKAQQAFDQRKTEKRSFFGSIFDAFKTIITLSAVVASAVTGNLVVALGAAALLYLDAV